MVRNEEDTLNNFLWEGMYTCIGMHGVLKSPAPAPWGPSPFLPQFCFKILQDAFHAI